MKCAYTSTAFSSLLTIPATAGIFSVLDRVELNVSTSSGSFSVSRMTGLQALPAVYIMTKTSENLRVRGSGAGVKAFLDLVEFTPRLDFSGDVRVQCQLFSRGESVRLALALQVRSLNDLPTVSSPRFLSCVEDEQCEPFGGVAIADVDSDMISLVLEVSKGLLGFGDNWHSSVEINGTSQDVTATLKGYAGRINQINI
jgi:hypothetical protein